MNRREILNSLLEYEDIGQVTKDLAQFPWDSEEELVELKAPHIINVLNKFMHSEISAQDVEDWANAIEGREDIAFDADNADVINELANPLLTRELTVESANQLITSLMHK